VTGIVLAGGENRRMGTDKAFLLLSGVPLIERIIAALRTLCSGIIVVTNSPERYRSYDVTVVTDALDQRGPLTGIYTGLLHTKDEYNLVVACDMPYLHPGLLAYLAGLAGEADVVAPSVGGRPEPLHAVYRTSIIGDIEAHLQQGRLRLQDLLQAVRVRYVTEQEIDRFDPSRRSFKNLNTPQEYEEAACAV
jgi:molybdopterin-guanine dinucleotide biosynthesis protein A